MSTNSSIEWTDTTWNPVLGCTMCSPGCARCYAETMSKRLKGMAKADKKKKRNPGRKAHYLNVIGDNGKWNGKIELVPEALNDPFHWKEPRMVFTNSMSDLFHEDVPFEFVDKVFAVMALCPQHTFQVLTKRPERMAEYLNIHIRREVRGYWMGEFGVFANAILGGEVEDEPQWFKDAYRQMKAFHYPDCPQPPKTLGDASLACPWPLPNVWLGTSCEDQARADERIPHLLKCQAAVRFLSCEPLLGPIDLEFNEIDIALEPDGAGKTAIAGPLHWVIAGGESGPGARPMHPDWARSIRDQCQSAGVAFFFKQWGEYFPVMEGDGVIVSSSKSSITLFATGQTKFTEEQKARKNPARDHGAGRCALMGRLGKKSAGRLLDGREWNEFPQIQEVTHA